MRVRRPLPLDLKKSKTSGSSLRCTGLGLCGSTIPALAQKSGPRSSGAPADRSAESSPASFIRRISASDARLILLPLMSPSFPGRNQAGDAVPLGMDNHIGVARHHSQRNKPDLAIVGSVVDPRDDDALEDQRRQQQVDPTLDHDLATLVLVPLELQCSPQTIADYEVYTF